MNGPRPRIVITAGSNPSTVNHAWLRFDYLHAVSKARGLPSIIASGFTNPLDEAAQLAGEILDGCDGLLLSGGTDVDPKIFGEIPHTALGRVDCSVRRRRPDSIRRCRGDFQRPFSED